MYNWINPKDFSFNSFLLMDRWLIGMILNHREGEFTRNMAIALAHHTDVAWYFMNRCPECAERIRELVTSAPGNLPEEEIKKAEEYIIDGTDWAIVYVWPEVMNAACPYIRGWDPDRLLSMTDFTDKLVLDVGSGTGRLAFAAAAKARKVYASEPVDRLREYMRDKIKSLGITNMVVVDGTVEAIPYEDNTFDIVMSAHVVGDDYDRELKELTRVTKPNGFIIDCMGEDDRKRPEPNMELLKAGFTASHYDSKNGGDVYRYIKQVIK